MACSAESCFLPPLCLQLPLGSGGTEACSPHCNRRLLGVTQAIITTLILTDLGLRLPPLCLQLPLGSRGTEARSPQGPRRCPWLWSLPSSSQNPILHIPPLPLQLLLGSGGTKACFPHCDEKATNCYLCYDDNPCPHTSQPAPAFPAPADTPRQ